MAGRCDAILFIYIIIIIIIITITIIYSDGAFAAPHRRPYTCGLASPLWAAAKATAVAVHPCETVKAKIRVFY